MNINTNKSDLFLIKIRYAQGRICDASGLMNVLKEEKTGVEFIKRYDPSKKGFSRISRKDILMLCEYDTAAHIYLSSHYYFQGVR